MSTYSYTSQYCTRVTKTFSGGVCTGANTITAQVTTVVPLLVCQTVSDTGASAAGSSKKLLTCTATSYTSATYAKSDCSGTATAVATPAVACTGGTTTNTYTAPPAATVPVAGALALAASAAAGAALISLY